MNDLLEKTKARLKELGSEPKRSLGQNFLISDLAVGKVIAAVRGLEPRSLIEIGPGVGALTDGLSQLGIPLLIIELDREFAAYWRQQGHQVIENDALKVDWETLPAAAPAVLVSNLPYQISTHLVVDRCFGPRSLTGMVLMFQKEVAERLMSGPRSKEYGLLSVMAQAFWEMSKVLEAGPTQFWPAPKVASQVLLFKRKPSPLPGGEREFLTLLKVAFAQRRKVLVKNLLALPPAFKINQERIAAAIEAAGAAPRTRAEELSTDQYLKLYRALKGL